MKIVSNTGPIIGPAKIELLFLLNEGASKVLIPPMVHRELLGKVGMESEQIDKALKEFLFVTDLNPLDPATEMAISGLDEGERQAIGLASTMVGDVLLLVDDRAEEKCTKSLYQVRSISNIVFYSFYKRDKINFVFSDQG